MNWLKMASDTLNNFLSVDWEAVHFRQEVFAWEAGFFIAGLCFIKIFWGLFKKNRSSFNYVYHHSGLLFRKENRPGLFYKTIRYSAVLLFLAGTMLLLVSLADPYFVMSQESRQIQIREIIYISDASASMGFPFKNARRTRAEVKQEALFKTIAKRKEKHDRTAYIVFSTEASIWSGFTSSFDGIVFTISQAPVIYAPANAKEAWPGDFIAKEFTPKESSATNLHIALQEAMYLFDKKGSPDITKTMKENPSLRMRSVVILTDGAADQDPEPQFIELRKRHIVPYLIFIDPDQEVEAKMYGKDSIKIKLSRELMATVRRYGGQAFMANADDSPEKISKVLDKLHSIKYDVKNKAVESDIYYIPLALSCFCYILAILIRIITPTMWRVI